MLTSWTELQHNWWNKGDFSSWSSHVVLSCFVTLLDKPNSSQTSRSWSWPGLFGLLDKGQQWTTSPFVWKRSKTHDFRHPGAVIWCHLACSNSPKETRREEFQRLNKPCHTTKVSPLVPVWGRSSSQPWPTLCTPGRALPPDLWQPPCPGTGPAGSGPAGLPWPWRWSWGRGVHTSADPQALGGKESRRQMYKQKDSEGKNVKEHTDSSKMFGYMKNILINMSLLYFSKKHYRPLSSDSGKVNGPDWVKFVKREWFPTQPRHV